MGLHAVARAGVLTGKRILVTGSGPIGLLTARCARHAGAAEVVTTDTAAWPLEVARRHMGVTATVNVATHPDGLAVFMREGGHFDVVFEASGSALALESIFKFIRRGGPIIQVGMLPPPQLRFR